MWLSPLFFNKGEGKGKLKLRSFGSLLQVRRLNAEVETCLSSRPVSSLVFSIELPLASPCGKLVPGALLRACDMQGALENVSVETRGSG